MFYVKRAGEGLGGVWGGEGGPRPREARGPPSPLRKNRPAACLINTCGGGEITIRSRPYDHAIQRQPCPL